MIHDWDNLEKKADTRDARFYSFAFADWMRKLNTNNEEVIDYFYGACEDWIREFDIDGIRYNVANEVFHRFLKKCANAFGRSGPICICWERSGMTPASGLRATSMIP